MPFYTRLKQRYSFVPLDDGRGTFARRVCTFMVHGPGQAGWRSSAWRRFCLDTTWVSSADFACLPFQPLPIGSLTGRTQLAELASPQQCTSLNLRSEPSKPSMGHDQHAGDPTPRAETSRAGQGRCLRRTIFVIIKDQASPTL